MTKEQFQKVLQKIKEHIKAHGGNDKDVVIKIAPANGHAGHGFGAGHEKPEENVPVPPPAFAPKDK